MSFDLESLKNSENVKIKKYKNCFYFGIIIVDGHKCGKGIIVYQNGRIYEGDWKNDWY